MPRCSTLSTPLINSLLCLLLCIPLHCSPSDLMKSQWEVEGDIIDTHPTQLNPTTVGAHHTAAGIWDQTIDTKKCFGALQWSDLYCPVMRMCKTHHVAMIMIYFMEAATVVVWFSQCVEKTNIWNVRMDASKGVSVKVTGLLLFPALDNLPLMLCYDTVQMCLFDMSNFHLTFTSSKMLNI